MRIVGKIATALWGALRMSYERNGKTNKGEGTRESRMHIRTHSLQEEKNRARHFRVSPGRVVVKNYSERRKFSKSCCWLGESESKFSST